jgi:hypothetical protein
VTVEKLKEWYALQKQRWAFLLDHNFLDWAREYSARYDVLDDSDNSGLRRFLYLDDGHNHDHIDKVIMCDHVWQSTILRELASQAGLAVSGTYKKPVRFTTLNSLRSWCIDQGIWYWHDHDSNCPECAGYDPENICSIAKEPKAWDDLEDYELKTVLLYIAEYQ